MRYAFRGGYKLLDIPSWMSRHRFSGAYVRWGTQNRLGGRAISNLQWQVDRDPVAAVSMFFFHVRTGERFARDEEGIDLPDLDAARQEATASVREIVANAILAGEPVGDRAVHVVDQTDALVFAIQFRDVIRL
jgi:hypothetical protein